MQSNPTSEESRQALHDIRRIMERSSRFLTLSGWSGIWAGCIALAGAAAGYAWLPEGTDEFHHLTGAGRQGAGAPYCFCGAAFYKPLIIGLATFLIAFAGAYYFTWRKARATGAPLWNAPSRQFMLQVAVPILAGGVFCLAFLYNGALEFVAPACLVFYGLALVSGSKYTLGEIRWLGYCEILLGCIALFVPWHGLAFLAGGFGILHIVYGIVMWNKYDKGKKHLA